MQQTWKGVPESKLPTRPLHGITEQLWTPRLDNMFYSPKKINCAMKTQNIYVVE